MVAKCPGWHGHFGEEEGNNRTSGLRDLVRRFLQPRHREGKEGHSQKSRSPNSGLSSIPFLSWSCSCPTSYACYPHQPPLFPTWSLWSPFYLPCTLSHHLNGIKSTGDLLSFKSSGLPKALLLDFTSIVEAVPSFNGLSFFGTSFFGFFSMYLVFSSVLPLMAWPLTLSAKPSHFLRSSLCLSPAPLSF